MWGLYPFCWAPPPPGRAGRLRCVGGGAPKLMNGGEEGLVHVAPHPVHATFPVRLDDRVACGLVMAEGVLVLGFLATAEVTTGHAQPERGPGVTKCDALLAGVRCRGDWSEFGSVSTRCWAKPACPGPP